MALPSLPAAGANWSTWGSAVHDAVNTVNGNVTYAPAPTGNDRAALQALIDALPAAGGVVQLRAGTYTLTTAPLAVPSRVTLVGTGAGTLIKQTTAGVPVVVSAAWLTGSTASILGGTTIRDLVIVGTTGATAHGIVLYDYRSLIENVAVYECGGDGIRVTTTNQAGVSLGSTLVENRFDGLVITDCAGWGFNAVSAGPYLTDAFLGNIAVAGNGPSAGGVNIGTAAGWSIGHVHTYGPMTGPAVAISGAWNTWLHSAQIESGWSTYGLVLWGVQRGMHVGDVAITYSDATGLEAVHAEKSSSLNPGDGVIIDSLTVIQDYANAATAVTWDSTTSPLRIGALNLSGSEKARIVSVGGFGASSIRLLADARVLGQLSDTPTQTALTYNGANLAVGQRQGWDGGGALTVTFSMTIVSFTSTSALLMIGGARFNNSTQRVGYAGMLFLSAKDNTVDAWGVYLNPLGTPFGLTAGPTVSVTGSGDTRTVSVAFTPTDTDAFGASAALVRVPQ